MKRSKNKRLKPLKNVDTLSRLLFLETFLLLFFPLFVLGPFIFGGIKKAIAIAFIASLAISPVVMFALGRFSSNVASLIYGGGHRTWNEREQLDVDLNTAKYYKMKKEFDQALKTVNRILEIDPDLSEALFLKAQILWEGFENPTVAKGYLKKVIEKKQDKNETIHRWASNLYYELSEIEKNRETHLQGEVSGALFLCHIFQRGHRINDLRLKQ
jgi:tetratricopeptide (TPR) repeat protein